MPLVGVDPLFYNRWSWAERWNEAINAKNPSPYGEDCPPHETFISCASASKASSPGAGAASALGAAAR